MIRILMDILGVILWCSAVYVCAYDWENCKDMTVGNTSCGSDHDRTQDVEYNRSVKNRR